VAERTNQPATVAPINGRPVLKKGWDSLIIILNSAVALTWLTSHENFRFVNYNWVGRSDFKRATTLFISSCSTTLKSHLWAGSPLHIFSNLHYSSITSDASQPNCLRWWFDDKTSVPQCLEDEFEEKTKRERERERERERKSGWRLSHLDSSPFAEIKAPLRSFSDTTDHIHSFEICWTSIFFAQVRHFLWLTTD
jgi:hypothetical protein